MTSDRNMEMQERIMINTGKFQYYFIKQQKIYVGLKMSVKLKCLTIT